MKKNLLRAAAIAGFCLLAAGTAPQAFADSAKGPTVSAAAGKTLQAAQKALQDKDWTTALDKLKDARAVSNLTDYDNYVINYYTGIADVNLKDYAGAANAFVAAAQSTAAPIDQRKEPISLAIRLENQISNWPKVIELGKLAADNNVVDDTIAGVLAIAYVNTNDYTNAQLYAQKSIDLSTAAGKLPDRSSYQVVLLCQNKKKDIAGETKTLETLANLYGTSNDWGNLLTIALGTLSTTNKGNHELLALFLFRLRLATGAETTGDDWLLAADVAIGQNVLGGAKQTAIYSPGDAQQFLNAGLKSGALSQAQAAAPLAKANAKAKGDEASLPTAEKDASKEANGNGAVSVAEGYYGYGRYADAERVATLAISKGGPKTTEAELVLGCAQAMQGENAAATQTFSQVKGDPGFERVAYLWTLYATRKYGQPAATPAPAAN
jgi:hypothetical protein